MTARKSAMDASRAKRNAAVKADIDAGRARRSTSGATKAVQRVTLDTAFDEAVQSAAAKLAMVRVRFD